MPVCSDLWGLRFDPWLRFFKKLLRKYFCSILTCTPCMIMTVWYGRISQWQPSRSYIFIKPWILILGGILDYLPFHLLSSLSIDLYRLICFCLFCWWSWEYTYSMVTLRGVIVSTIQVHVILNNIPESTRIVWWQNRFQNSLSEARSWRSVNAFVCNHAIMRLMLNNGLNNINIIAENDLASVNTY